MEPDLLQKEEQYRKENQKLEIRTKQLMQRVDEVMKLQDSLLKETLSSTVILDECSNDNNFESNHNGDAITLEELKLPKTVDELGTKAKSSFFKAQIKSLQNDLDKLQRDYTLKIEEVKRLQKENKQLNDQRIKMFAQTTNGKSTINKLEAKVNILNSKLSGKDSEINVLKKENEALRKEIKTLKGEMSGLELRLNRSFGDIEKYKNDLKMAKANEKDIIESHRKKLDELENTAKDIEKYKTDLLMGFKKQLLLIDNLKKQKLHLESSKLAEISQNNYMKLLDWNMSSLNKS